MKKIMITVFLVASLTISNTVFAQHDSTDKTKHPKEITITVADPNCDQCDQEEEKDCCKDKNKQHDEKK